MRRLLPLILLVAVGACTDGGPVSGPGTMTATLQSPNGDEGAAVIVFQADDVGAVTSVGDTEATSFSGDSSTQVVLIHPTGGTLLFQVEVADTTQPPPFTFEEVAGPDDELRPSLTGYDLLFVR